LQLNLYDLPKLGESGAGALASRWLRLSPLFARRHPRL